MPPGAAAGRRPDPCRARWRHSSPRPQRAEGLRLGLAVPPGLSDPLHGAIQFRLHRIALALLERGPIPPIAFSRHCSSRKISTPNWRDRSCTGSSRKRQNVTLARHRSPKSQRACRQSLAWGKRGRAKLARIYHRPINSNFLRKIIGHVPVLLGHFGQFSKAVPCVRDCQPPMRSNNPSLKRPESLVAPEQNSVSDSPLHFGAKGGG